MLDQLKIKNLTNILVCLFSKQKATKAELVQWTGLSNSTVSSTVNSLLKLNLLVCAGMEGSIGGRRSTIYRLNKDYGEFIGVDIKEGELTLVVTDCENNILQRYSWGIDGSQPVIDLLTGALEQTIAGCSHVLGIGIGLDAQIDHKEQVIRHCDVCNWHYVHLKEIIERQFLIFTYLDHRVNGAAVREGVMGRACGLNNYLCCYESVAQKVALVLDGQICRGHRNYTGRMKEPENLIQSAETLVHFLDLSKVFIGYRTEERKIELLKLAQAIPEKVVCFPETEDTIPVGMAAVAQKEWFQSIYFML